MSWISALEDCRRRGEAAVLVTIVDVKGSAPRGVGTRLLVRACGIVDTIGGGALEREGIRHARRLLAAKPVEPVIVTRNFPLGKALSQCCGGHVTLSFDVLPANDFRVEVFGAGHVGQALAHVLERLPCIATFHDRRAGWLARLDAHERIASRTDAPDCSRGDSIPDIDLGRAGAATGEERAQHAGRIRAACHGENVHREVERCAPGAYYLIMTHSHELDLEVVEAVLSRGDAAYCGLIASKSKATVFRSRLARKGFDADEIAALTAPIGAAVRTGNTPMEVAIAALSDVLTARERRSSATRSENARATKSSSGTGEFSGAGSRGP